MAFVDPTLAAGLSVFGETATLARDPVVSLSGVFTAPDSLRRYGGVTVDTVDAALTVTTTAIADLDISADERISVRGLPYRVVAVLEDDGAGSAILLRRLLA